MSSLAAARADNFYYPPHFDPVKHGTLAKLTGQHPLRERAARLSEGILVIRFEVPFNIWCQECGEMIAKGVRFNADKQAVGNYLSTKIWKFSMRHHCGCKISIQTDPKNAAYVITEGARKKVEEYTAASAEVIDLGDSADKAALSDPFYRLEHGSEVTRRTSSAAQALAALVDAQDVRHHDPYSINKALRARLRNLKAEDAALERQRDALGLARGVKLLPHNDADAGDAALAFFKNDAAAQRAKQRQRQDIMGQSIFSSPAAPATSSSSSSSSGGGTPGKPGVPAGVGGGGSAAAPAAGRRGDTAFPPAPRTAAGVRFAGGVGPAHPGRGGEAWGGPPPDRRAASGSAPAAGAGHRADGRHALPAPGSEISPFRPRDLPHQDQHQHQHNQRHDQGSASHHHHGHHHQQHQHHQHQQSHQQSHQQQQQQQQLPPQPQQHARHGLSAAAAPAPVPTPHSSSAPAAPHTDRTSRPSPVEPHLPPTSSSHHHHHHHHRDHHDAVPSVRPAAPRASSHQLTRASASPSPSSSAPAQAAPAAQRPAGVIRLPLSRLTGGGATPGAPPAPNDAQPRSYSDALRTEHAPAHSQHPQSAVGGGRAPGGNSGGVSQAGVEVSHHNRASHGSSLTSHLAATPPVSSISLSAKVQQQVRRQQLAIANGTFQAKGSTPSAGKRGSGSVHGGSGSGGSVSPAPAASKRTLGEKAALLAKRQRLDPGIRLRLTAPRPSNW
ncbi:MAG: hypothetical protein WDW38_006908 [Sanguina aurantia]